MGVNETVIESDLADTSPLLLTHDERASPITDRTITPIQNMWWDMVGGGEMDDFQLLLCRIIIYIVYIY